MRAKSKIVILTSCVLLAGYSHAAEEIFVNPDSTKFYFQFNESGANKFCNLNMAAVKVPQAIYLISVAMRNGSGDHSMAFGYEIKFDDSTMRNGMPSIPKGVKVKAAAISSNLFSSADSVDRVQSESALYTVRESALSRFTNTITRGDYFINAELSDGRNFTYVIRDDVSLLNAADKWLKCAIQIAK